MGDTSDTQHSSEPGNLFDSVMSEFKYRIKIVPPESQTENKENLSAKSQAESVNGSEKPNGIAEYSLYCRRVEGETNHYNTLPAKKSLVNQNASPPKRTSPPTKPIRKKKPLNGKVQTLSRTSDLDEKRISSEIHELIESAFSSGEKNSKEENLTTHETPNHDNYIDEPRTLTRSNINNESHRSSVNSSYLAPLESSEVNHMDESDGYNFEFNQLPDDVTYESINDMRLETVSMYSALSDEDGSSNTWLSADAWSRDGAEDTVSMSSFASAEGILGEKFNYKKKQGKTRAKMLKKQAAVQKERMGALLDAAATNATERIRKLRKPSIKFPHGKAKILQQLANRVGQSKQCDQISNISGPITQNSQDGDENNQPAKKSISTLLEGSYAPPADTDNAANIRQRAIKSGYLKKQGGKIKTWNERWFVLKGDQLHYYKDVDGKHIASIFLPGNHVTQHPMRNNDTHKFVFEIFAGNDRGKMANNHESYLLSANSQTDMEEWIKVIRRVILSPFGGGIFGQRLDETMRYDRRLDSTGSGTGSKSKTKPQTFRRQAPIIVENCVHFIRANKGLSEEGLFRLPGHANEVKELQDAYDMGERPVFPSSTDVHTVASLLKGYLRELPEPVIPFERYDQLMVAAKLAQNDDSVKQNVQEDKLTKEQEEARKIIKDQLDLLPQPNYDLLRYLCRFLDEVQRYSEQNKMDISNLAMVFGPNIMRAQKNDPLTMMADTNNVQHIMFQFISNHEYYFPDDDKTVGANTQSIPDVAIDAIGRSAEDAATNGDAGIGTLTSTVSPLGTLGMRHTTDDSGTGSMGPTPENTSKRTPPVPIMPPPLRNKPTKPNKPLRRKLSSQLSSDYLQASVIEEGNRKSYYDNVTTSSTTGTDVEASFKPPPLPPNDWRQSNESADTISHSSVATGQDSYYVNNQSTPTGSQRSSTNAVAGSVGAPDFCHSSPVDDSPNSRYRENPRMNRRQKARHASQATDEESNTESIPPDDRAFSTLSSHRSSYPNNADVNTYQEQPRSSSYSQVTNLERQKNKNSTSNEASRPSARSVGDGVTTPGVPIVPLRSHRKIKKDDGSQSSGSQRSSKTDSLSAPSGNGHQVAGMSLPRSSQVTSTSNSSGGKPLSYKELEDQITVLQEELQKQRLEHEKRSRMLEEHYIMKMRSTQTHPYSSRPFQSFSVGAIEDLSASPAPFPRSSVTDDSMLDTFDASASASNTGVNRTMSDEPQGDRRYHEEVKRHAITKIRLRNAERGLLQAEERNMQLQKEMEQFFETFGSLMNPA